MATEVKSEIAGTVWKCLVKPGQSVAQDEPLIILESMKMEIPIASPIAGTVEAVLVSEKDMVEEDQTVARLTGP